MAAVLVASVPAGAATRSVSAESGAAIRVITTVAPGDTVLLQTGAHRGPLKVLRPLVLMGRPGAVVDAAGQGSGIEVFASGVTVQDLEVRRSGKDVMHTDAGIQVLNGSGVTLRHLRIRDCLYGIYAERARGLRIEDCQLRGRVAPRLETGEGNGIHLWYCDSVSVEGSSVERFLDAIYLSFTGRSRIEANQIFDCGRYGLHTMYCQENRLIRNRFTRNVAGCAIMFSNHLEVERNDFVHNRGSRTYGLLLRDCSDGHFLDNRLVDNTVGVFMDNSNRNHFLGNLVQDNGWGVLVFSSCAGNEFASNNFLGDDYPVSLDMRYTSNRFDDGRAGNFWSDNAAYDLDSDGLSDVPYSPVSAFAFVSEQYPDLTVLSRSPAVAALGVAERVFPFLRPSEAVDRFPRVAPVPMTTSPLPKAAEASPTAWGALAGFCALGLLGVGGFAWSRRA